MKGDNEKSRWVIRETRLNAKIEIPVHPVCPSMTAGAIKVGLDDQSDGHRAL